MMNNKYLIVFSPNDQHYILYVNGLIVDYGFITYEQAYNCYLKFFAQPVMGGGFNPFNYDLL